jgi:dimethylargininase
MAAPVLALTRPVSDSLARCELTHLARQPVDLARARAQHRAYEAALEELGCELRRLPAADELPDAVFVEDLAVVVDECAVLTRPGAASRRPERAAMEAALDGLRPLHRLRAPARLDGGDVLRSGRRLWVGMSGRSDRAGIEQLGAALAPHGYEVRGVALRGCLHLKSAACEVAPGLLLVQPEWVDPAAFRGCATLTVDPSEPFAANAVAVGGAVVHPAAFPRTRARLEAEGLRVRPVEADELAKAEGAVSCCSVLVPRLD